MYIYTYVCIVISIEFSDIYTCIYTYINFRSK